jgi:hypothetical protein
MHNSRHPADKLPPPRETLPYQFGRGFGRQTALPGPLNVRFRPISRLNTRAAPVLYSFRSPAPSCSQLRSVNWLGVVGNAVTGSSWPC